VIIENVCDIFSLERERKKKEEKLFDRNSGEDMKRKVEEDEKFVFRSIFILFF
jgi:hypothetical protein